MDTTEQERKRIGRRVRRLRQTAGLSQKELSRLAWGTTRRQPDVAAIEGGRRTLGLRTATDLARGLGVGWTDLLESK